MGGCIYVPYKAKARTESSAGPINRDVLQPGTPRTSVTEMFGNAVVAAGPHLTWARDQFSDSGAFFFAVGGGPQGPGGVIDSDSRYWQTQNLMIEFDEQDRVNQHRIVTDSKLLPEVEKLLNDGTLETPTFTPPVTLTFVVERGSPISTRVTERLTLSEGGISWAARHKPNLQVSPAALINVRHRKSCPAPETLELEHMNETLCASFDLQTAEKPIHVTERVSARDFFVLVAYARKFHHANDLGY
jgi:hypothetical protein